MKQRGRRRLVNQHRWPWRSYRAWQIWQHRHVKHFLRESQLQERKRLPEVWRFFTNQE